MIHQVPWDVALLVNNVDYFVIAPGVSCEKTCTNHFPDWKYIEPFSEGRWQLDAGEQRNVHNGYIFILESAMMYIEDCSKDCC
jgi:hypothetical protein